MCQGKVCLTDNGEKRLVAEDAILLEEVPGGVSLRTFFDEPQVVWARVASIDFLKHIVSLIPEEGANDAWRHSAGVCAAASLVEAQRQRRARPGVSSVGPLGARPGRRPA